MNARAATSSVDARLCDFTRGFGRATIRFVSALGAASALLVAPPAVAADLSVDELRGLSERSPNVFDTFLGYQPTYERYRPIGFFDFNLVLGPDVTIDVDGEDLDAVVAGGQVDGGSVFWRPNPGQGLRAGFDFFSTNLTPDGSPNDDGWGFRSGLIYGSWFDTEAGYTTTAGIYFSQRPVTSVVNQEVVFSYDDEGNTTEVDGTSAFLHGTLPLIHFTTAMLIDDEGIRQARATTDIIRGDLWGTIGPDLTAFPRLDLYLFGAHARSVRPWTLPFALSTELAGRHTGDGDTAFNHVVFGTQLHFLGYHPIAEPLEDAPQDAPEDKSPKRSRPWIFDLRLDASYINLPEAQQNWGGSGLLDLGYYPAALRGGSWRVSLGLSHNYYHDIVMLPIADVGMGRLIVTVVVL